ncbi:acryloyl-CoA reductase [Paenibacillus donghaensis]|uniref:Oxidoreductase n=1 Tax=Paenibacillus donghaensis TaxID=414771 RepID=A0A2Z2KB29_9BACL|nr:acryloyl-CoA reductase [Paenibacillus donghaensis]ASA20835.1 oxidoreductase [Paenibacillus donghaensis]
MSETFQALVVNKTEQSFTVEVKPVALKDLPEGEVLIRVAYSSVNYKDGLAAIPDGKILKSYPFIPGVDLAGEVVSSTDERFREGDQVIASGNGIGVSHFGGYSQYARIPADWVIPMPAGLTAREAMIYGTAGFTAALSIHELEQHGLDKDKGKVLVTGATGGVGGAAIAMLAGQGYQVVASTGQADAVAYLEGLGASEVISREDVLGTGKPLDKQLWQAAVDSVGGSPLASILSRLRYKGSVAASGLTAGTSVPATVLPFILRGVNLLGIDSVMCPADIRQLIWKRMGADLKPANLEQLVDREVTLESLPEALGDILQSKTIGRVLVRLF